VLFARWGVKRMLLAGMGAWVLRYLLFAAGAPDAIYWMIALGILLHGICYDFFFVTGMIYVDKKSTSAIRGQAQGFFVFVTYGVGMLIGAQVAGNVYNRFLAGATALTLDQWRSFWILPAAFAAVVLVFFGLTFNDREAEAKRRAAVPAGAEAATPAGP
jgi:Nucleoside H+ symporter